MSVETSVVYQLDQNGKESLMYVVSHEGVSLHNALPLAKRLKERDISQKVVVEVWTNDSMNWKIPEEEFLTFSIADAYCMDMEIDKEVFVVVQYGNGDGDSIVSVIVEDEKRAVYNARSEKQEWKYWTFRIEVWRAGHRIRVMNESDLGIQGTKVMFNS